MSDLSKEDVRKLSEARNREGRRGGTGFEVRADPHHGRVDAEASDRRAREAKANFDAYWASRPKKAK